MRTSKGSFPIFVLLSTTRDLTCATLCHAPLLHANIDNVDITYSRQTIVLWCSVDPSSLRNEFSSNNECRREVRCRTTTELNFEIVNEWHPEMRLCRAPRSTACSIELSVAYSKLAIFHSVESTDEETDDRWSWWNCERPISHVDERACRFPSEVSVAE